MDLGPTPIEPVTPLVARSVGVVLAAVHEVAPKTDRPIEGQWVNAAHRPTDAQWTALLERARAAGTDWAVELAGLSSTIGELSAIAAEARQESIVITNRDLGINSVRIGEAGELVVIHWDFAGPMMPEWELATTLMHWTGSGTNLEVAQPLLTGYRERRGFAPRLSMSAFSPAITGWLTWLLHRAWEATDPQPSEKREFSERTLRETLDDPLTLAKLEAIMGAAS
jgi:thiamine kinase-like enzyme